MATQTDIATAAAPDANPSRKLNLKTAEGDLFEVEEAVAMEFGTVKSYFEDNDDAIGAEVKVIPLPLVSAGSLSQIIAYTSKQLSFAANSSSEDEKNKYKEEFLKGLSNEDLKEIILATNYLNVKGLLDVLNQAVADLIKNKSVEFVRKFFGIENDFSPDEEAALRQEFSWAFEGVDED